MEDLTNILQDDDNINEEELRKYLSGNISDEERHVIEKKMAASEFVSDAVEGLQGLSSHQKLDSYVDHLNKDLHQYLVGKKEIKEKRKIRDLSWIIVAVIIILLLCMLAYIVVKMQRDRQIQRNSISVQNNIINDRTDSFIL
jgi:ABC-type transport system involved in cytochrome bd biosynthesis fused ATPase/permease subunit